MKKALPLFILFCMLSFQGITQNLSPSIVSTQGGIDHNGKITLEWTLGENLVETVGYGAHIITQGFHQPILDISNERELIPVSEPGHEIAIGPNPVHSFLNIYLEADRDQQLRIVLFDIYGRSVGNKTAFTEDVHITLNVVDLSPGIYLLNISDVHGSIVQTSKILKIN